MSLMWMRFIVVSRKFVQQSYVGNEFRSHVLEIRSVVVRGRLVQMS